MLLGLGWFQLPIFTNRSIFPVMGVMIMLTTIGCKHTPPHITVPYTALASDLVSAVGVLSVVLPVADACLAVCLR